MANQHSQQDSDARWTVHDNAARTQHYFKTSDKHHDNLCNYLQISVRPRGMVLQASIAQSQSPDHAYHVHVQSCILTSETQSAFEPLDYTSAVHAKRTQHAGTKIFPNKRKWILR